LNAPHSKFEWFFEVLGSGTSQGVPVVGCACAVCASNSPKDQRLRSSFFVQKGQTRVLVDAGPDLRQQLLRSAIHDLDAVLITHEHQDHTAGLDELRAINFIQGHAIPIYCTEQVENRLREQYSYIFKNSDYPGIPQIHFVRLPEEKFQIGEMEIEPLKLWHANLPVTAFRFGPLAYLTDVNAIPENAYPQLQNLEVLILNALRQKAHHSHFTLEEAIAIAYKLQVPQLYATHISHQMGLHESIEKNLAPGRNLAFDGLKIQL
jgi:phosphoribosyl 1,2-cyclic phosphate phosphodiesterase